MSKEFDAWSSFEAAEFFLRSAKTSTALTCYSAGLAFLAKGFYLASTAFWCSVVAPGKTEETWLLPKRPPFSFLNYSLKLIGAA